MQDTSSAAGVFGLRISPAASRVLVAVWFGGCALLAAALFTSFNTPYANDDTWITYRYAENLANGLGFVYNRGERVLGTSTPLYTLILAVTHWIGLPVPVVSKAIGFVAMLGILGATYLLGKAMHSVEVGLVAVALLVPQQMFHRVVTYGMETPVYLACILFCFYAYTQQRLRLAACLAACALLLRADGAAVAAAVVLAYGLSHRKLPPLPLIGLFLGMIAPWYLFSYAYFGAVLPHSFIAKRLHSDSTFRVWVFVWLGHMWLAGFALIGSVACLARVRCRAASLPLVIWFGLYALAFGLSNLTGHEWYKTPLTAPLALLGAVALLELARASVRFGVKQSWVVALATAALLLAEGDLRVGLRRLRKHSVDWRDDLEHGRYDGSVWMNANLPKDAVIVTDGIGHPGYVTHRYILDAAGLVSPQVVVKGLPPAWPRFLPYIVEHMHPEYVFIATNGVPKYMERDFRIVREWQTGYPGGPFVLMERKTEGHTNAPAF